MEMEKTLTTMAEIDELLRDYRFMWDCIRNIISVIDETKRVTWSGLDPESFEDSAKSMVTSLRRLPKNAKTSDAFKGADRLVKEFMSTCPLIISLRSPAMRERHWRELMDVVQKQFELPARNPKMLLKDLLDLELHLHASDVEEITEKAMKEAKHEDSLKSLESTWSTVEFTMSWYKDTDVPLIRLGTQTPTHTPTHTPSSTLHLLLHLLLHTQLPHSNQNPYSTDPHTQLSTH